MDGGSEFMAEFEEACQQYNVKLFVLPPKSPKLNGHVERMQRTFRDEFYTQPLPSRIPELQQELNAYLDYYNRERPHRALNGPAPLEFLAKTQGEMGDGVKSERGVRVKDEIREGADRMQEESVPEGGESQM